LRRVGAAAACLAALWTFTSLAQTPREGPEAVFGRAMTALHNFEYEDANEAFGLAQRLDPGFALAYWGEAMTYHQTLWRRENVEAARQVLGRLGPTAAARAAKARTPKTRGLLGAVDLLFGNGDVASRRQNYAASMGRLHASLPDDDDIAALYGLALMGTAAHGLLGSAESPEGVGRALAGSAIQSQAASIFNDVLARNPDHPGALHYLLHDYDDPDHASLALDAARRYRSVARGSSHALHMPAHIFVQLGLWQEAEQSDLASFEASREWVARKQLGPAMRNYHAWNWRQYELLQLGRYDAAWQALQEVEPVARAEAPAAAHGSHQPLLADLSSMRARYVIETRRWDLLARERNFGNADELLAIGLSAARTGNAQLAEIARGALAARAQSDQEGDLRPSIAIMEREVAAILALAAGRRDEAVGILNAAAQAELNLPAPFGLPSPPKPAPELLGEVLIEIGRPQDADVWFERALSRNANRTLSVLGRARAAVASGQPAAARQHYEALLANFEHADANLSEVREARAALSTTTSPTLVPTNRGLWPTIGGLVVIVSIAGWLKMRRREKPATKARKKKR
jgi:tetratricopeptide (TPR) repeat protein